MLFWFQLSDSHESNDLEMKLKSVLLHYTNLWNKAKFVSSNAAISDLNISL